MKILFAITALGPACGGHFFSLDHTSKEIAKHADVKIISIGESASPVVSKNPYFFKHIPFNGVSLIKLNRELRHLSNEYRPDIIHCFDIRSYSALVCLSALRKAPLVVTQCGGPNPTFYPKVDNLILFSHENKMWFEAQKKFKNTTIHLIPNRVLRLTIQEDQPLPKDASKFTFILVNRINPKYKKGMLDTIELVRYLYNQNLPVKLVIIGVSEDAIVYQELVSIISKDKLPVTILTDNKFTKKASDYLYLADAVIGTGRGFMEAASLGIPLLTRVCNGNYPVVVDRDNFDGFFETNFSPRNLARPKNLEENLDKIKRLTTDSNYYKSQSQFAIEMFEEFFNVQKSGKIYLQVYDSALAKGRNKGLMSDFSSNLMSMTSFSKSLRTGKTRQFFKTLFLRLKR